MAPIGVGVTRRASWYGAADGTVVTGPLRSPEGHLGKCAAIVREELSHHPRGELPAILLIEKHHRPGGYALLASHKAKVLRCGCLDTHL